MENAVFSPMVAVPFSIGWGVTTYDILSNRSDSYGKWVGNEKIKPWAEHLHLGYGLYGMGFVLKHRFPSFYRSLPYGARLLFSSGGLIQLDDMYQHLYLHKRDGFDADDDAGGQIAESPVHRLYVWSQQPERMDEYKIMLDLVSIDRFTLSTGFYQGPAAEVSYRLHDLDRPRAALMVKSIVGFGFTDHEEVKRLGVEQCVTGISGMLYLNSWCALEIGSGLRLFSNNPDLDGKTAFFYGLQFGPRPAR
ncbi:MAG: hypothetical protein ABIJ00_04720 [Candidatus Eisenbacteria bacterium]